MVFSVENKPLDRGERHRPSREAALCTGSLDKGSSAEKWVFAACDRASCLMSAPLARPSDRRPGGGGGRSGHGQCENNGAQPPCLQIQSVHTGSTTGGQRLSHQCPERQASAKCLPRQPQRPHIPVLLCSRRNFPRTPAAVVAARRRAPAISVVKLPEPHECQHFRRLSPAGLPQEDVHNLCAIRDTPP